MNPVPRPYRGIIGGSGGDGGGAGWSAFPPILEGEKDRMPISGSLDPITRIRLRHRPNL